MTKVRSLATELFLILHDNSDLFPSGEAYFPRKRVEKVESELLGGAAVVVLAGQGEALVLEPL